MQKTLDQVKEAVRTGKVRELFERVGLPWRDDSGANRTDPYYEATWIGAEQGRKLSMTEKDELMKEFPSLGVRHPDEDELVPMGSDENAG